MKPILSFFKKNLFLINLYSVTFLLTISSISQGQGTAHMTDGQTDFAGSLYELGGAGVIILGGVLAIASSFSSTEISVDNDEIINQKEKLLQYKYPFRVSLESENIFGTIKSITNEELMLNEKSDPIKLKDITSITDLNSAYYNDEAFKKGMSTFTLFSGIGACIIAPGISPADAKNQRTLKFGSYLTFGIGAALITTSIFIMTSSSDSEKEWDRLYPMQQIQPPTSSINLHLQIGTLNLGEVHTASNVVYTNISPCITARLCF